MALSVRDLKALLGKHQNYLTQDGEINTPLLYRYAQECNTDLLTLLSTDDDARNEFFIRHGEHIIFVRDRFIDYIHHKDFLANSYTAYKNKVGLAGLARYGDLSLLKSMHDVVLSFPFKDCVLEGGQNKDEAKRNERYYNRVLAADEIDRLLDPKVLTNAQRYTEHERQPLKQFTRDANINEQRGSSADTITDNLIIKGNNLLALHTLREQFAHKVKLIYIDPPYNTGNDSFHYNDSFNHSTWLVFMKNRLEAARELLRQDGVIFVQCDDNEQAYLKVLMDEVFGRENFVNNITANMSNLSGNKIEHAIQGRKFPKIKEYILLYSKSSKYKLTIPKTIKDKWDEEYNIILPYLTQEDFYKIQGFIDNKNRDELENLLKKHKIESLKEYLKKQNIKEQEKWKIENSYRILASKPNKSIREKALQTNFNSQLAALESSNGKLKIIRTDFNKDTETSRIELVFAKNHLEVFLGDIWLNITTTGGVAQEGGVILKNGKKPEELLDIIIKASTKPGDIVLDYHLGSGTTAAVAHKIGRQYIGIEQMDYIESVSVARLQKVIEGEQGGISKAVNWQGGGNFVYFELKAHNQTFISHIAAATTTKELLAIKEDILAKADLDYRLDTEMVNQSPKEFSALSQEYQKQILLDFLEINQLYVPYTERDDTRFACTNEEKQVSEMFYQQL